MKINILRIILIILLLCTFSIIFGFSSQDSKKSSSISRTVTIFLTNNIKSIQEKNDIEKGQILHRIENIIRKIALDKNRVIIGIQNYIERKKEYIKRIKAAKLEKIPLDIINKHRLLIDSSMKDAYNALLIMIEKYKSKCMQCIAKLDALSPLKTLSRGYSVVETLDGKLVKSTSDVKKDDELILTLTDGKVNVIVE